MYQQIGILPETGWSIDPFGVGSTIPYLLTAAGINKGYLIQRIHFAWKRFLARIGGLDAVWRPDFTNNDQYDMPLRVQHSSTYSLTDSCGILPKLCSLYDFNRAKKAVNFSNIRRRAEVSCLDFLFIYLSCLLLNSLRQRLFIFGPKQTSFWLICTFLR